MLKLFVLSGDDPPRFAQSASLTMDEIHLWLYLFPELVSARREGSILTIGIAGQRMGKPGYSFIECDSSIGGRLSIALRESFQVAQMQRIQTEGYSLVHTENDGEEESIQP
jgi:hypothetical protein